MIVDVNVDVDVDVAGPVIVAVHVNGNAPVDVIAPFTLSKRASIDEPREHPAYGPTFAPSASTYATSSSAARSCATRASPAPVTSFIRNENTRGG